MGLNPLLLFNEIKKLYKSDETRYFLLILIPVITVSLESIIHIDVVLTIILTSITRIPLQNQLEIQQNIYLYITVKLLPLLKVTVGNTVEIIIAIIAISQGGLIDL
jgi:hypothetical protein